MKNPLEVVELLNEKLYGEKGEFEQNFPHYFSYTKSNYIESISLDINLEDSHIKIHLWNSENSQQIYIEKINDYEPLENTIIREYKKVIKKLIKLKSYITK